MIRAFCVAGAFVAAFGLSGCEMVVGEFTADGCQPDPPASCGDISSDAEVAQRGCCSSDGHRVWFCQDGEAVYMDCGELSCDFDPDLDAVTCVE